MKEVCLPTELFFSCVTAYWLATAMSLIQTMLTICLQTSKVMVTI